MGPLTAWYERNKKMLVFALACTFLWGLADHGYCIPSYQVIEI